MSDQNRFDEYKQKLLHYWSLFLAACGRLWDQVKAYTAKSVAFLRRGADLIADTVGKASDVVSAHARKALGKAAAWLLKVRNWLKQKWARYGKPVLRKIACWLLKIREKVQPGVQKFRGWFAAVGAWFAAQKAKVQKALPKPKPRELPPTEEPAQAVADAPAAVPALPEAREESQVPAAAVAEEKPAQQKGRSSRITNPTLLKILAVLAVIGKYLKLVIKWIWKLRTIFMAIPVVWAAVKLAMENMDRLPDRVGLDIQSTGEFARMITKTEAVFWPLGLTAFCLVLMFCSKKPLLPWVISIFTLVLPVLIWVLNYYA